MALEVKNLPASAGDTKATDPITGRPPWRRKWQPTPVFLPEKFHGQSSVVGCSSWSCKESDTTEPAHTHTHTHTHTHARAHLKDMLKLYIKDLFAGMLKEPPKKVSHAQERQSRCPSLLRD